MGECGELALDLFESLRLHLCGDGRVPRRPVPHDFLLDALDQRPPLPGAPLRCVAAQELLGLSKGLPVGPLLRSQPGSLPLTVAGDLPVRELIPGACLRQSQRPGRARGRRHRPSGAHAPLAGS